MKKLFILICIAALTIPGYTQFSLGPRVGANFASITGKWNSNDKSKHRWITGPVAGAVGNYAFTDRYSLSTELLYLWMGEKTIRTEEDRIGMLKSSTYSFREIYNCLQLVILARIMFGIGNMITLHGFFGPFLTYKLGGWWRNDNGNSGPIRWGVQPLNSMLKIGDDGNTWYVDPANNSRLDFGLYLGGGAGRKLGPGRLDLDVRFGFGLLDLNKFDSKDDRQNAKDEGYKAYHSMNFSVSLIYMYLFSK